MKAVLLTGGFLFLLTDSRAQAVTGAKRRPFFPHIVTHQIIPSETQKAGQDIELRKVQAMLSGQRPKKVGKTDSRR